MSRRWLDEEQRWSCRMKLPVNGPENTSTIHNHVPKPPATKTMDQPTEIATRRRNGDMSAAIRSISNMDDEMDDLELPSDPDAQATVTDFLDFTEYLPSDMIRSLTLIGNLDQTCVKASRRVDNLTRQYGKLPLPTGTIGLSAVSLRERISQSLDEAVNARNLAYNEADRMCQYVERHHSRAQNILAKLQAMKAAYPESREPSPTAQPSSSPRAVRPPKITLRLDGARTTAANQGAAHPHKHRPPRITVPGEVLAPYELEYDSAGFDSDDSTSLDDEPLTPRDTPARILGNTGGRIKLKISKGQKARNQKTPRAPRPPGVMGTNVHSAVAGISTSNALAQLEPPPENAVLGSKDAPWLRLTDWELAKLRKRMKKNAIWNPSDTMVARELKILGRGIEAYRTAKNKAEAAGQPFDHTLPSQVDDGSGKKTMAAGSLSIDTLDGADVQLSNRGMKLNEAKKLKRENQAKELAKQAAEEAEESARKMAEAARAMSTLFAKPGGQKKASESPSKPLVKTPARKRKRESTADTTDTTKADGDSSQSTIKPQQKRSKVETPVPAPRSSAGSQASILPIALVATTSTESLPLIETVSNPSGPLETTTVTTTTTIPLRASSPKKSSTPILPPTKDLKSKKPAATPATATRQRTSAAQTPTPAPEALPARRASSRPVSRGKAASVEPASTASRDRPRRASTVHNTPAPEANPIRAIGKRAKRPAPGPVTSSAEGSAAVSFGKRTAAPRKKAGPKKQPKGEEKDTAEIWDEVDDEGNVIDPDEPRYCSCNRVSFGVMICCENVDCEKEWFHLECVGLTAIPPRTTKWYCPDCRVALGIGEKGEVTARGKKK